MISATMFPTTNIGANEKHTSYMNITHELTKRELASAKLHQMIFTPSVPRREDTSTICAGSGSILCIQSKLVASAKALKGKFYGQVIIVYYKMRACATTTQVLWV